MIITTIQGTNYSAIMLSNDVLNEEKVEAFAGCRVKIESVFVRSSALKDGFYFLPNGKIVNTPHYGYTACISYSDIEEWKECNEVGRIYGRECGINKDGEEYYSGRTPKASTLI